LTNFHEFFWSGAVYEWHELIKLRQWSHSIRVRVRVWVAWWRFALSECFL